jgi:hypothetical protein
VGTGTKEDESSTGRVWADGFHHFTVHSRLTGVLKIMNRLFNFETFFPARGKPQIPETADTNSVDTGAHLYTVAPHSGSQSNPTYTLYDQPRGLVVSISGY